jgi:hypothetical protein
MTEILISNDNMISINHPFYEKETTLILRRSQGKRNVPEGIS